MHGLPDLDDTEWKQVKNLALLFTKESDGKYSYLQCCVSAFLSWAMQNGVKIEFQYDDPIAEPKDGKMH